MADILDIAGASATDRTVLNPGTYERIIITSVAYCFRSGEVAVARKEPSGALALLRGLANVLRNLIEGAAWHSRTSDTLFVPGVPEAPTDDAALDAAAAWAKWLASTRQDLSYLGAIYTNSRKR